MIYSLPWSLDYLFSVPFCITSSNSTNSFLTQPPFTISAPTIILWHSYSLPSLVFPLPTPPPLCLAQTPYLSISVLTPSPLSILFLLLSAINCIQDYCYFVLSLLYICIGVTFLCFATLSIFFYLCKAP